ncbi:hypothetical protein ACQEU6_14610 [Spirillospora sp. CA-108201]
MGRGKKFSTPAFALIFVAALYLMTARHASARHPGGQDGPEEEETDAMDTSTVLAALGVLAPPLAAVITVADARLRARRDHRPPVGDE